ncbi:N-acetyltransferase [Sphingobacterium spiritivorum]|uniref:N-acetyltransferase n=1 Tax=Sphingobacterium spiritivorum TaxID=258 RepID=UPI003DA3C048
MKIITKFVIATEQDIERLSLLAKDISTEKFSSVVEEKQLRTYLAANFNEKHLLKEVNSLSNQWLMVSVDDRPAGFARITSKGIRPDMCSRKRMIRIADFGILKAYANTTASDSLLQKCLALCRSYDSIWIAEYVEDSLKEYFERNAFITLHNSGEHEGLPLPSVYMLREQP